VVTQEVQFPQWAAVDKRPYAVLHVGPHKCASSALQTVIYDKFRDEVESDGFALPYSSEIRAPHPYGREKVFASLAFMLRPAWVDDNGSQKWINVTEFFDRAHRAQKPLALSAEEFSVPTVNVPLLKSFLAPWRTHVVVIYRPYYDWLVSLHNEQFCSHSVSEPITEWLTVDMISGLASTFSMELRNRYLAHGFKVTVLALNSSLLFDFVCGVMSASRTCHKLRETPNAVHKVNARKSYPCMAKLCLLSDKLEIMLNLSVQFDGAMPAEVQRSEPFLRQDFAEKVRSEYFCSCAEPPLKKIR